MYLCLCVCIHVCNMYVSIFTECSHEFSIEITHGILVIKSNVNESTRILTPTHVSIAIHSHLQDRLQCIDPKVFGRHFMENGN